MKIFLQYPFDLDKLEIKKNKEIITFDHESHTILSQKNIKHLQSENYLTEADFLLMEKICYELTEWFIKNDISKEITFEGINLGSLFRWELQYYLVPVIKKIFEMEKIAMKENDSTCSCSYSLRKFAEMFFTEIRLLDKIERENELLFDNIKWNLTKNLEINLGKRDFERIKKFTQKGLLHFSKLKKKNKEKKLILFTEFNQIKYENLFLNIKNSDIQPIFFNFRRPYFWNLKSFNIINQTEGQIITDKILTKNNKQNILENQKGIKSKFSDLLKDFDFENFFIVNNNSFWNIIKKEFSNMCFTRMDEAIELIEIAKEMFIHNDINEILIWSENGFSEQVILELGSRKKIPVNLIQHGIIVDDDSKRNLKFNEFSGILPKKSNKFLVWNKSTKNYAQRSGFPNNDIIPIGNSSFDKILPNKNKNKKNDSYVLLTTTSPIKIQHAGYNTKFLDNYISQLQKICKNIQSLNKKLIIRPHPFAHEFDIAKSIKKSFPEVIIDKKTDITTLVSDSSMVISLGITSVIFEAQVLGKPVFFISSDHDIFGLPKYLTDNPNLMIEISDIKEKISKIYQDKKFNDMIISTNTNHVSNEFFNLGNSTHKLLSFFS